MNHHHVSFQPPDAPQTNQQPETVTKPRKLRRISRACDFCHKRSIRCKPSSEDGSRCQNCLDFGVACTYNRPAKKRGIKSGSGKATPGLGSGPGDANDGETDARMLLDLQNGVQGNGNFNVVDRFVIPEKWKGIVAANEGKIHDLIEVYFEVVYPLYPLFQSHCVMDKVNSRAWLSDHSLFADIMAICALASARARDGALFPAGRWDPERFQTPSSEVFFAVAKDVMPPELGAMRGLDWMRTCAVLALYGIQVGNIEIMHQYLGMYHSLVNMDGLHDEMNWPKDIGMMEVELRRRLFWSVYTLEVYSSIVWGSIISCRESQAHVSYPSEIDDELFCDPDYMASSQFTSVTDPIAWLHGWNFTTDLYRILEHATDNLHRRRKPAPRAPFSTFDLFGRELPHRNVVLEKVMSMHAALPPRFRDTNLIPQNGEAGLGDKISFQAANITATLQLVRMILFTAEDATVDQKCAIARELLEGFAKVPVFFLRAISSPLLHHIAGVGAILGSVMEAPLSESAYLQVRAVLLAMADLLASLEEGITRTVGASTRLRNQITNIDRYMATQRSQEASQFQQAQFADQNPKLANLSYPTNNHSILNPVPTGQLKHELPQSNPNIDPVLRDGATSYGGGYTYAPTANSASMNHMLGQNGDVNFQFQVPPDMLAGFPWNFDMSQGFGGF